MTLLGKSAERLLLTAACAVGLGLGLRLPWLLADAPVLLARHGFDDLFYFTQVAHNLVPLPLGRDGHRSAECTAH